MFPAENNEGRYPCFFEVDVVLFGWSDWVACSVYSVAYGTGAVRLRRIQA